LAAQEGKFGMSVTRPGHTQFSGTGGIGPCVLPSAQVGDRVLAVINANTSANESGSFETVISKNAQIQQTSASNLSGSSYLASRSGAAAFHSTSEAPKNARRNR
jgi:hypothetical protein